MLLDIYTDLFVSVFGSFGVVFRFWYIWSPFVLFPLARQTWLSWVRYKYIASQNWTILEIQMPRAIEKGPKAMEQALANLHGYRNDPGSWLEKYRDGEVTLWFSFELVSVAGNIRFFIHTPRQHKNGVEANLYAQYPNIDIKEVPDYLEQLHPRTLPELYEQGRDLWGTEVMLDKEDHIPIRSYTEFESKDEFQNIDTMASVLETLRSLGPGESAVMQIIARPASNAWQKKGGEKVKEIKEKASSLKVSEEGASRVERSSPGDIQFLKLIEQKLIKPGFEVIIRLVYIADAAVFSSGSVRRGFMSILNQVGSDIYNKFAINHKVSTLVQWVYYPYLFPKRRAEGRKSRLLRNLRERRVPAHDKVQGLYDSVMLSSGFAHRPFILNTEELATIYHFPTQTVLTGPLLERQEAKRMGPPAGLPIFTDQDPSNIIPR